MNNRSSLLNLSALCVATVSLFLASSLASADVTFTASGEILTGANAGSTDLTQAASGDQVQVDIFMTNTSMLVGAALAADIPGDFNMGANTLNLDGGTTAAAWFATGLNKTGAPVGGVPNGDGTDNGTDPFYTSIAIPRTISSDDITLSGNIRFFSAFLITGNGDGQFDYGTLDGGGALPLTTPDVGTGAEGAAHVRLLFTVVGTGATLGIGDNIDSDITETGGVLGTINAASIQVPEPGSVTVGLSALASVFAVVGIRRRTS